MKMNWYNFVIALVLIGGIAAEAPTDEYWGEQW